MLTSSEILFRIVLSFLLTGSQLGGNAEYREMRYRRASGFDYSHPDEWGLDNPTCSGTRQSPIDINGTQVSQLDGVPPLVWTGYEKVPLKMTLKNNGHSVVVDASWKDDEIPTISGGILGGEYAFAQFHFHWGSKDEVGSEHTVNGCRFPLELHMVHYKKEYGSFSNATQQDDGLAVVGVFYKIDQNDEEDRGLCEIQDQMGDTESPNSKTDIKEPFPLSDLNIDFEDDYATYLGSLTTPPCSEIVTWIVSATPSWVTHKQMEVFRKAELSHEDDHNYRPTMDLNDRTISYVPSQQEPDKGFDSDL